MLSRPLLAIAIGFGSLNAAAAQYYLVTALPGKHAVATTPEKPVTAPDKPEPALDVAVALSGVSLPAGVAGQPYQAFDLNAALMVSGDPNFSAASVTWAITSGSLPAGLALSANGIISGTPTAGGTSAFRLQATYKSKSGAQDYQIVVSSITITLAPATLPGATVGAAYSYDLRTLMSVSGDPTFDWAGLAWSFGANTLPAGLTISASGLISGTPTAAGTGAVIARATYKGRYAEQTYNVTAAALPNLKILSATYGANLGAPTGNRTAYVGALCDGKVSCMLPSGGLYSAAAGGDPYPGRVKDLVLEYACSGVTKPVYRYAAKDAGTVSINVGCS